MYERDYVQNPTYNHDRIISRQVGTYLLINYLECRLGPLVLSKQCGERFLSPPQRDLINKKRFYMKLLY